MGIMGMRIMATMPVQVKIHRGKHKNQIKYLIEI